MNTRVLIVGAGGVARRHAGVLAGLGGVEIVGIVDPEVSAAQALAADHGAAVDTEVERALDRTEPDAVYVCVPPFAHGAAERAALDRRLPIFVEKPIGLDLETVEDVALRAEEAGVVTATGYHWRCLDVLPRARRLVDDAPALAAAGHWLDKRPPVSWWAHRERSGGQVVEQLTHVLDLARLLLGEAEEVYAAGVRATGPGDMGDVDDATAAMVRFDSGAVATFTATSLLGAKQRASLQTFSRGFSLELSELGLVVDRGTDREEHPVVEDPRVVVDREFIEAVRGQRPATRTSYEEALVTHRLGCAMATSAREARPMHLDPSGAAGHR